jgi:hypothetical protein
MPTLSRPAFGMPRRGSSRARWAGSNATRTLGLHGQSRGGSTITNQELTSSWRQEALKSPGALGVRPSVPRSRPSPGIRSGGHCSLQRYGSMNTPSPPTSVVPVRSSDLSTAPRANDEGRPDSELSLSRASVFPTATGPATRSAPPAEPVGSGCPQLPRLHGTRNNDVGIVVSRPTWHRTRGLDLQISPAS